MLDGGYQVIGVKIMKELKNLENWSEYHMLIDFNDYPELFKDLILVVINQQKEIEKLKNSLSVN
jgi:hypothetical protein